jgi:hypothetical protein
MDKDTQERLDSLLEEEIRKGFRIKEVPLQLQAEMKANSVAVVDRVRFTRPNPRRKSKIASEVQRKYHADLKNQDILSNQQITESVEARGEWTVKMAERMFQLSDETQELQSQLFLDGIASGNWGTDLLETSIKLRDTLELTEYADPAEKEKVLSVLERWCAYMPSLRNEYSVLYAAEQGKSEYSVDNDLAYLMERMPSEDALSALEKMDDLRDKAVRFIELKQKRVELAGLQDKHAKIFSDSVESRRDQAEEMARIYFCTELLDEKDTPTGPLCKTFDALWDFPEEFIRWLIIEQYFFANGLADEAREYLEVFGFLKADRTESEETQPANGDSAPSVESPVPQSSKGDTTLPEGMVPGSSE